MLPEYRDLIAKLRQSDRHFIKLFDEHNELDHEIKRLEDNPATAVSARDEIEAKKKAKLQKKDEIYQYIKKIEAEGQ